MPINYRQDLQAQGQVQVQAVQSQSPGILRADTSSEQNKLGAAQAAGGMLGAWLSTKIEQGKAQDALAGATNKVVQDANASAREVVDAVAQGAAESAFPDAYKQGATALAAQTVAQKSLHNAFTAVQTETAKPAFKDWQAPAAFIQAQSDAQRKMEEELQALPGITPEWLMKVRASGIQAVQQGGQDYSRAYATRYTAEMNAADRANLQANGVQLFISGLKATGQDRDQAFAQSLATFLAPAVGIKEDMAKVNRKQAAETLLFTITNGDLNQQQRLVGYKALLRVGGEFSQEFMRDTAEKLRSTLQKENAAAGSYEMSRAKLAAEAGILFKAPEGSILHGVDITRPVQMRDAINKAYHVDGNLSEEGYTKLLGMVDDVSRAYLNFAQDGKPKMFTVAPDAQGNQQVQWNIDSMSAALNAGQYDAVRSAMKAGSATQGASFFTTAQRLMSRAPKQAQSALVGIVRDEAEVWAGTQLDALAAGTASGMTILGTASIIGGTLGLSANAGPKYRELSAALGKAQGSLDINDAQDVVKFEAALTQNAVAKQQVGIAAKATGTGPAVVGKVLRADYALADSTPEQAAVQSAVVAYAALTGTQLNSADAVQDAVERLYVQHDPDTGAGVLLDATVAQRLPNASARTLLNATAQAVISRIGLTGAEDVAAMRDALRTGSGTFRLPNGNFVEASTRIMYRDGVSVVEYKTAGEGWKPYGVTVSSADVLAGYQYVVGTPIGRTSAQVNDTRTVPLGLQYLPPVVKGLQIPQDPREQYAMLDKLDGTFNVSTNAGALARSLVRLPKGASADATQTYYAKAIAEHLTAVGVVAAHNTGSKTQVRKAQAEVLRLAQQPTNKPEEIAALADTLAKGDAQQAKYLRNWLSRQALPKLSGLTSDLLNTAKR